MKTSSRTPDFIPYREGLSLRYYATSPTVPTNAEPLIDIEDDASETVDLVSHRAQLEAEDVQRFTATGRPMPKHKISAWANLVDGGMGPAPIFVPQRFTDESIIPVVVKLPASNNGMEMPVRRKSFLGKLKPRKQSKDMTKIVFMPRGEYLKRFAKDEAGNYIGTEPQREWTAVELDDMFGKYDKTKEWRRGSYA